MDKRIAQAAGKAVGTGAVMWILSGVVGKAWNGFVSKDTAPAIQQSAFTLGMIGAGLMAEPAEREYATACVSIGAAYGAAMVAVAVIEPTLPKAAPATGLPPGSTLQTKYLGEDASGVPVYEANYA